MTNNAHPPVAWLNGALVDWPDARLPIEDRAVQFAEGLYEILPVTAGRARMLEAHHARMLRGAEILGLQRGVPPIADWESLAGALIERGGVEHGLLYAQLTGGEAPRAYLGGEGARPNFFAYLRPHRFPDAERAARGIRAISMPDPRWEQTHMKTTMLLPGVLAKRRAAERGADEAILLGSSGIVREGASSTVFFVEGDRLVSPEPSVHILPGVTGPVVRRVARREGLACASERVPLERLLAADEVFVAATSLLVMGVGAVDRQAIGAGRPGPVTQRIAAGVRGVFDLPD